jgi:hypothetical protein
MDTYVLLETQCIKNIEDDNYEDCLLEAIYEYIDSDIMNSVLLEFADATTNKYKPLLETIDEVKKNIDDIHKEPDEEKKNGIIQKTINSFKSLISWFFKEDPNKKFKTLHIVIKLGIKIIFALYFANMTMGPLTSKLKDTNILKKGAKAISKVDIIGKGVNAVNDKVMATAAVKKVSKAMPKVLGMKTKKLIRSIITGMEMTLISYKKDVNDKIYDSVNSKDLDNNIKRYNQNIKEFDKIIDETKDNEEFVNEIKSIRERYEKALANLILLKVAHMKKDKRKEEVQDKA